jgi:hypothetical protein
MQLQVHANHVLNFLICELIFSISLQKIYICFESTHIERFSSSNKSSKTKKKGIISLLVSVDSLGVKKNQALNVSTFSPSALTLPPPLRLQEEKKEGIKIFCFKREI